MGTVSSGLYVLMQCAVLFIDIITLAMTARMIMSFFFAENDSKLGQFLAILTEPVIMPIRALCGLFGWFQGLPMDMPFFITALLLMVLRMFLAGAV